MPETTPRTKKAKRAAMKTVMHEFKKGKLRSGSPRGPKVKSRAQAIAIGLNESGQSDRSKAARNKRLKDVPL